MRAYNRKRKPKHETRVKYYNGFEEFGYYETHYRNTKRITLLDNFKRLRLRAYRLDNL